MTFPIGTRVLMSEIGKRMYKNASSNPHDLLGEVYRYLPINEVGHESFKYRVRWSNQSGNNYREIDLSPIILDTPIKDYL